MSRRAGSAAACAAERSAASRRYSRRALFRLGAGTVAGLAGAALLGCTGEEVRPTTATSTPQGQVRVRAPLPPTSAMPVSSVLRLGTLTSEVGADGLDPVGRALTYSRLVSVDPRSAEVYGDLVEAIEMPEPLIVNLTLRPEVFFHPDAIGQANPLTAYEVVREVERRREEGVFLFSEVIEAAEASSDTALTLRLRAPFSLLFEFLARPDASIRGELEYPTVSAPLGSGPFFPAQRSDDLLTFRRHPLLQGDARPRLTELRLLSAPVDGDLDAAFTTRRVDVRVHPTEASRKRALDVPGRVEVARARYRMRGLALSLLAPRDQASQAMVDAFRDPRVRRAVSLAVDRRALTEMEPSVLSGPVGPAFGGDALPLVELESHPLYAYDVEESRALLAAAGHEGLTVRISHADSSMTLAMAQALVDQLAAAGIEGRLVARNASEFEQSFFNGDFEAAFFEFDQLTTPDLGLRLHTTGGLEGERSPWGYSNPVYDAAVQEALSQIDPLHRTRQSRDAQRLLLDDVPAMFPLTAPLEFASLGEGVHGYEFNAYGHNAAMLARQWEGPALDPLTRH